MIFFLKPLTFGVLIGKKNVLSKCSPSQISQIICTNKQSSPVLSASLPSYCTARPDVILLLMRPLTATEIHHKKSKLQSLLSAEVGTSGTEQGTLHNNQGTGAGVVATSPSSVLKAVTSLLPPHMQSSNSSIAMSLNNSSIYLLMEDVRFVL
jgi:hypothetical protein